MKRIMLSLLALFLLLCAGCSSSKPEEGEKAPEETPEEVKPEQETKVETEEVVYDDNGVRITYLGYEIPGEGVEYDSMLDIHLRIEKTADSVSFGIVRTAADGWLTGSDDLITIHTSELTSEPLDRTLKIPSLIRDFYGAETVSSADLLIAVKQGEVNVLDKVHIPLSSDQNKSAVSSVTKGYYDPNMLVELNNPSDKLVRAFYLVKAKDDTGRKLCGFNMMSGEYADARIAYTYVRPGASSMPAALLEFKYNFWAPEDDLNNYADPSEYTVEFLYASGYQNNDISEQVTVTDIAREGGNDSKVSASVEWPDSYAKIAALGTLLRYQNGELKSVDADFPNNLDKSDEYNDIFYFDAYDSDYSNETYEVIVNYAYEVK